MNRILALVLCLAMLLCVLAGCDSEEGPYVPTGDALEMEGSNATTAPQAPAEQDFSMAYYPDRPLNPYLAGDYTNRTLIPLMYQSLFSVDRNYNVTPILCDSYRVSGDMKTYTFVPAKALFSDGTTLTANDVAASLNAARGENSYYKGRFLHVTSITAEGGAVVVQLDTPCENLPLLLDIPIVKATEVDSASPLGTGPYVLDNAVSGKRLRRQAAWWCSGKTDLVVTASYIPLVAATSPSQIRDQFEFGDVGIVCADPGSDTYADFRCDYELWDCENGLFLYLVCSSKSEVFSNDAVRKALTHAIDRDLLVEEYYRGFAHSATLPASPMSPYYDATLAARYGFNSKKFTDALTEAELQGAAVTMLINSEDSLRIRVGRRIAKMLTECGLEVTLQELPPDEFKENLLWGTYDLYLGQTKLSANMDLTSFFRNGGSLSYGGLADATIYTMALEALTNRGNYYNLHELVMEDAQLCPILTRSYAVYADRGLVSRLSPSRDNLFYYTLGKTMEDIFEK